MDATRQAIERLSQLRGYGGSLDPVDVYCKGRPCQHQRDALLPMRNDEYTLALAFMAEHRLGGNMALEIDNETKTGCGNCDRVVSGGIMVVTMQKVTFRLCCTCWTTLRLKVREFFKDDPR